LSDSIKNETIAVVAEESKLKEKKLHQLMRMLILKSKANQKKRK
jgi:hypothetical protein